MALPESTHCIPTDNNNWIRPFRKYSTSRNGINYNSVPTFSTLSIIRTLPHRTQSWEIRQKGKSFPLPWITGGYNSRFDTRFNQRIKRPDNSNPTAFPAIFAAGFVKRTRLPLGKGGPPVLEISLF